MNTLYVFAASSLSLYEQEQVSATVKMKEKRGLLTSCDHSYSVSGLCWQSGSLIQSLVGRMQAPIPPT